MQSSETRTAQRAKKSEVIDSRLDGLHGFGVRILIEYLDNILFSCDAVVRPHALFSATSTFAHKALSTHCIARNMHSNCAGLKPR